MASCRVRGAAAEQCQPAGTGQHMGKCPTAGTPELCPPMGHSPRAPLCRALLALCCHSIPPTRTNQAAAAGHRASLHPAGLTPAIKLNHSHLTGSLSSSLPEPQPVNPARAQLDPSTAKPDIPDSVTPVYLQLRLCTQK